MWKTVAMTFARTPAIKLPRISPKQYQICTIVACFFIGAIIVTGAAVRVTGSGLGCTTWPQCTSSSLLPHKSESYHAFVEFGNRLFTGLLSISVIVAIATSFLREPRSKTLIWLSSGLVLGVIAQIVLGGVTVLVGLNPLFVAAHMIVSCFLLSCAVVLAVASKRKESPSLTGLFTPNRQLLVLLQTFLIIILGTVVTAAGPHAGDEKVERLNVSIETVARIHSLAAWALVGTIAYLIFIKKDRTQSLLALAVIIIIQGAWGYTQYALSVPSWMVLVHVLLATIMFAVANVYWTTSVQKRLF